MQDMIAHNLAVSEQESNANAVRLTALLNAEGGSMYEVTHHSIKGIKIIEFEAEGDMAAVKKGQDIIDQFEKDNVCHVYREYLFRKDDDGTETELCI